MVNVADGFNLFALCDKMGDMATPASVCCLPIHIIEYSEIFPSVSPERTREQDPLAILLQLRSP
jgi:hypothetical protein